MAIAIRKPKSSRVFGLVAGLMLAATTGAVAVPGTADARCKGEGVRATSRLYMNGNTVVEESPYQGQCDGDRVYRGFYESTRGGWTAWIETRNNGSSNWVRWSMDPPGASTWGTYVRSGAPDFRLILCATDFKVTRCGFGDQWKQTRYGDPVNRTYTGISWGY